MKFFSTYLPQILGKNYMHSYDVHKALYQYCEIHGPWIRGLELGQDRIGHMVKM